MSELRIYFVDLIAFVPVVDDSVWVLLPEARQPILASDGMTTIDPHYPVVLFDFKNPNGEDWPQIHNLLNLTPPPGQHVAWLLNRQELRISVPANPPVQRPGTGPGATGLPTSTDWTDFTWVPDLAFQGIPAKVDPDCLRPAGNGSGQTPSAKIVARLHLETGGLTTFQFVKRPEPLDPQNLLVPRLELKPLVGGPASGPLRACADVAVATIPFTGPTIEVSAVNLDTGQPVPGRTIQLTPTGSVVSLLLGNLSPESATGYGPRYGVHFERYYDLLPVRPLQLPIPHLDPGFPDDPASYRSAVGVNGRTPTFIMEALQVPFAGFNGPICSLTTLQS